MQPLTLVSDMGFNGLSNPIQFEGAEQQRIFELRSLLNKRFNQAAIIKEETITNTAENAIRIEQFLQSQLSNAAAGQYSNPWGAGSSMNSDMYNIFFAERIIQEFQPELLVVNMQGVDVCHSNFTDYCNNLRKADFAVGKLWETIQNTPGMANDTILIVAPEHGRNLEPNTLTDAYGQFAIDHTSDPTSREIFCMIAGPAGKVVQNQIITQITGESIDIVPTIAHILGFRDQVPGGILPGRVLQESFI
jgi:membrane-anchored protein YejM (alkaline phosphatase superfamily)